MFTDPALVGHDARMVGVACMHWMVGVACMHVDLLVIRDAFAGKQVTVACMWREGSRCGLRCGLCIRKWVWFKVWLILTQVNRFSNMSRVLRWPKW